MNWSAVVIEPLQAILDRLAIVVPRLLGGLIILFVGWLIAAFLRKAVERVLSATAVNVLADRIGFSQTLRRGAISMTLGELIGLLGYWVIMIATIIVMLQFIGVTVASEWLERFGYFIPRLIISIVIFLFGTLLAGFLGTTVRVTCLNAGIPQGYLLGQVVSTAIVLLSVIVSLEQLQVVTRTIEVALYILMGAFGLASALALGLGGQDVVRRYLNTLWDQHKQNDNPR